MVGLQSIVHGEFDAEVEDVLLRYDALGIDVLLYKPLNRSFEGRIDGYRGSAEGIGLAEHVARSR